VSYLEIDDDNFDLFIGKYSGHVFTLVDDPMEESGKDQNISFWSDYHSVILPYLYGNNKYIGNNPDFNAWDNNN
jgi:hypothetical protein